MKYNPDRGDNWRAWFAWYPVKVAYNDGRWLEVVERRRVYYGWVYRAKEPS